VTTINLLCLFKDYDNVFAAGKAATGSLSPIPYLNHFEWVLQSALDFFLGNRTFEHPLPSMRGVLDHPNRRWRHE